MNSYYFVMTSYEFDNLEKVKDEVINVTKQVKQVIDTVAKSANAKFVKYVLEFIKKQDLVLLWNSKDWQPRFYGFHEHVIKLVDELFDNDFKLVRVKKDPRTKIYEISNNCVATAFLYELNHKAHLMVSGRDSSSGIRRESYEQAKLRMLHVYTIPILRTLDWKETLCYDTIEPELPTVLPYKITRKPKKYDLIQLVLEKILKKSKKHILIGTNAYNYIVNRVWKDFPDDKPTDLYMTEPNFIEFLSSEPNTSIKEICKLLTTQGTRELLATSTRTNFIGQVRIKKILIDYDGYRIAEVYDVSSECVPYNNYHDIQVASVHTILLYFYAGLWVADKINNDMLRNKLETMIFWLTKSWNYWLYKKKLTGIEPEAGLFKVFHLTCQGNQFMPIQEIKKRKFKGDKKAYIFRYDPIKNAHRKALQNKPQFN